MKLNVPLDGEVVIKVGESSCYASYPLYPNMNLHMNVVIVYLELNLQAMGE